MITTASDAVGATALDGFGAARGLRVEPGSHLAAVGAAVLSAQRVTLSMDQTWPVPALPPNVIRAPGPEPGVPAIVITDRVMVPALLLVIYRPPSLVLGARASRASTRPRWAT